MATRRGRMHAPRRIRRSESSLWRAGLTGVAAVTAVTLVLAAAGYVVALVVSLFY